MNPTEQKEHRTALKSLETEMVKAIKTLNDSISEEAADRMVGDLKCNDYTNLKCGEETTWRNKMAEDQRDYVDAADKKLATLLTFLTQQTTFWQRLRWAFTGRFL